MKGALSNINVLDLSRILAGPWASQTLADLGADVIKIERPGTGDDTRQWGPPYMQDESGKDSSESAYYMCANRGKRSVCIDMSSPEGQSQIQELASDSDIVVENFKVGQLAKYHLDYQTLSKLHPGLIYCSITGFGQTGPYKDRPGYDFLMQAMGGVMSVTGAEDGEPQKVGVAICDIMTGLYASIAILAAIAERSHSGLGQHIDLSLLDVTAATMANQATNYLVGKQVPKALGNSHPNVAPYQAFATSDSHCIIAVGNDSQFRNLCVVLDIPELANDSQYLNNTQRMANKAELAEHIQQKMLLKPRDEWLLAFEKAGVPAAPINSLDGVFNDPQILSRGMKINLPHPLNPNLELPGNPIKLSRTPVQYAAHPPMLGEHTEEVLAELAARRKKK